MADTLLLQVVSPERQLVEEQVSDVQVPALDGFIGVLPGHARLLSALKPGGVLSYHVAGGQEKVLAIYGGFVEVLPDRVRVLADGAEPREEINVQEAQKKLQEAQKLYEGPPGGIPDPAEVFDELMRSQARVDAAEKKS
jgi:F-type H+-transporting ATPase subunit epsilon